MFHRNKLAAIEPVRACVLGLCFALASAAVADAPPGYYDTVSTATPATLRSTLHAVIRAGHVKIPYTATSTDTWNVLELADQDPNDTRRIIDVYKNRTYLKYGAGNNDYDREHTWPKSLRLSRRRFDQQAVHRLPHADALRQQLQHFPQQQLLRRLQVRMHAAYPTDNYNGESGVNYRRTCCRRPLGNLDRPPRRRGPGPVLRRRPLRGRRQPSRT